MAATKAHILETTSNPQEAIITFAARYTVAATQERFWHLYKAWVCQQDEKKQHTEEEIALFLDQLIDLVAAAFQLHQTNRATPNQKEGHRD